MKSGAVTTYVLSVIATGSGVGEAATATNDVNVTYGLILGAAGIVLGIARLLFDRSNANRSHAQRDRELDIRERELND